MAFLEGDQEDSARADFEKAIELDPQLAEAYRALARQAEREGNLQAALEYIEESLRLNECGHPLEEWDIDCGEDAAFRIGFLSSRLEEGDDLLIQEETERIENVVFFDLSAAYNYFKLAYLRGEDDLVRDLGEVFVSIPPNRLFPNLQSEQSRVRKMLNADSLVPNYSQWPWPTGRLVEREFLQSLQESRALRESRDGLRTTDGRQVTELLFFQLPTPDRFRHDAVAWELFRGPYRLASYEAGRAWGEDWVVEFGLTHEPSPAQYELRFRVNGEPVGVTEMDVP
jgi:hypothetical protein